MTTKTKRKLHSITTNRQGDEHHFFASSLGRWSVSTDLQQLITRMKSDDLPFNLFLVPGPESRPYKIEYYTPQVEGVIFLAFYGYDDAVKDAAQRREALALSEEPTP